MRSIGAVRRCRLADEARAWQWPDGFCPCRSRQRHGAGFLAGEETIHYAFHPLAGKTVASTGRRVMHGRVELLTIRLTDGTLTLTPAWMMRPEAATCAIRPGPRLCVAHLRDLRTHLDALLGSGHGDSSPSGGANNAPEPPPTTGSVRRTAKSTADPERTSASDGGDSESASDGGVVERAFDADPQGGAR